MCLVLFECGWLCEVVIVNQEYQGKYYKCIYSLDDPARDFPTLPPRCPSSVFCQRPRDLRTILPYCDREQSWRGLTWWLVQ